MESVVQRLDPEAVASGEDGAVGLIPKHKGELAAQAMEALGAAIFVEMQSDFAVRSGAQAMPRLFQLPLD